MKIGKSGIITIDVWGKPWIGMTSELYKFVRQVVDEIAKKYNLLKVYSWGQDDGGTIVFNIEGIAVIRSYYSRGIVEIDGFGPVSEDDYWEYVTSKEYDEEIKEWR